MEENSKRLLSDAVSEVTSLIDLRLRSLDSQLVSPANRGTLTPGFSVHIEAAQLPGFAVCDYTYSLDGKDDREEPVVAIRSTFNLVFKIERDHPLSADELDSFSEVAGLEIVHPYVRELVHNMTGRMGLPPFVLEVRPPSNSSVTRPQ